MLGLLPSYLQEYLNPYSVQRMYSNWSSAHKNTKAFSVRTKSLESSSFLDCPRNIEI